MISIGIDIGSYSIKVARVEGTAKGFRVLSLEEHTLPTDPAKDPALDILEILRDVKKRHEQDSAQFIIGANQGFISSRNRIFPFKERHKILKSLPFELEDDIPFSFENAIFEAKITHYIENTSSVIAMACPKEHIVSLLQRMDDAEIEPSILSTEGTALGNLFEDWKEAPDQLAESETSSEAEIILNIGHKKTIGTIIQSGYPIENFTLDWGGSDLAHTMSLKYSLHYVEALKELKQKAFLLIHKEGATREQITLSDILKTETDKLTNQLRLIIAKVETEHSLKINNGTLTGGVSQLRNLGPYLTQKLEIPFNRLAELQNLNNMDFNSNPNNELAHMISIGLATEGVKRPKNPAVNFLKGEFQGQSEGIQVFWKTWGPAVQATIGLFFILLLWGMFRLGGAETLRFTAEDSLKDKAKEIMKTPKRPKNSAIKAYIKDQKQRSEKLEAFSNIQEAISAMDILKAISNVRPNQRNVGKMDVIELNIEDRIVNISGYADNTEVIQQFRSGLQGLSTNGKVNSQALTKRIPSGKKGFKLQFMTERRGSL